MKVGYVECGIDKRNALLDLLRNPRTDEEAAHYLAEKALCDYLRSVGDEEIASAWEKARDAQGWWYA